MELVAEEVAIQVAEPLYERATQAIAAGTDMTVGVRQIDVLGLTRADHATSSRRPVGLRAIEVKVSRSDLAAGIKKGQVGNGPGGIGSVVDYAHLLVVEGVRVDFGELPTGWGVLTAREQMVGSSDGQERTIIRIEVTKPAKRLAPTFALDLERVAHAITQSALWRLYGPQTEITHRRYVDREIAPSGIREIAAS